MSYPHHGLVQPALDVLSEVGKMLPPRQVIRLSVYADGTVSYVIDSDDCVHSMHDVPTEDGDYPAPDLIRLVQHVRRLEGLK